MADHDHGTVEKRSEHGELVDDAAHLALGVETISPEGEAPEKDDRGEGECFQHHGKRATDGFKMMCFIGQTSVLGVLAHTTKNK